MNVDDLRKECREKQRYSFGTARIFERRTRRLQLAQKLITFLGLLCPLAVGAIALSFSDSYKDIQPYALAIAGVLGIVQLIFSLWSLVARWDERNSYAVSSLKANTRLTTDFEDLAAADTIIVERDIPRLRDEYKRQDVEDTAQNITPEEKRFAMRQTLFQYKLQCVTCGQLPTSIKPSKCDTCGNF